MQTVYYSKLCTHNDKTPNAPIERINNNITVTSDNATTIGWWSHLPLLRTSINREDLIMSMTDRLAAFIRRRGANV